MLSHRLRAAAAFALLGAASVVAPAGAAPAGPLPADGQRIVCNLTDAAEVPVPAPPFGTAPCTGVRPGAKIQTAYGPCSMGFLFRGSDGHRYISTAGHCVLGLEETEASWARGGGSAASDGDGKRIGTAVYAVQRDVEGTPSGINDFALIRLDKGVAANPQTCQFGGPTSLDTSVENSQLVFQHVGTGVAGLRARSAFSPFGLNRPDYVYAHGVAYPGDSGGAVQRDTGAAVGLVTQLSYGPLGNIGINRLGPHLARAGELLGTTLTLQTAPLL